MKFRKKPVVVDAIRLDASRWSDAVTFVRDANVKGVQLEGGKLGMIISTLEGDMLANEGDWIIRGVKGELYPCKHEIFEATYEEA